tara:strand:- start:15 stop:452 length:438 start_codon:yes stop_codon:yes gene_type:complete
VYDDVIGQLKTMKIQRKTEKDLFANSDARLAWLERVERKREKREFRHMSELIHTLEQIRHVQWDNHVFYKEKGLHSYGKLKVWEEVFSQYDTGGVLYHFDQQKRSVLGSLKYQTVVELKKMLKENQVKGYSKMKKNELIKKVMAL